LKLDVFWVNSRYWPEQEFFVCGWDFLSVSAKSTLKKIYELTNSICTVRDNRG
jgi:hypothetical protein